MKITSETLREEMQEMQAKVDDFTKVISILRQEQSKHIGEDPFGLHKELDRLIDSMSDDRGGYWDQVHCHERTLEVRDQKERKEGIWAVIGSDE